jgi:phosphoribosylamine---glycine ligase
MRVLLLGSGGRESALAAALDRAPSVSELVAAPGNPGIAEFATTIASDLAAPEATVALAAEIDADLVVVGPEAPLVAGVADALSAHGRAVFGPSRAAARIEGSKAYAKELMARAGIPTARHDVFTDVDKAVAWLDELGPPYVVKADGLAAGKGVVVTSERAEAVAAVRDRIVDGRFGDAGRTVVIEEFLDGPEVSLIALTDAHTVLPLPPAQDFKRAHDGDRGPNTGGMGSYSPVPECPPGLAADIVEGVITPMVEASAAVGAPYSGAIYAGLALTSRGPLVVEFNARFGDPETQALLPRVTADVGELFAACARGDLAGAEVEVAPEVCVSVVLASDGYPGPHSVGAPITGVAEAAAMPGVEVFHAGTARRGDELVTAGGRVLSVSARDETFAAARRRAYAAAGLISFEGAALRRDIALRAELAEGTGP